MCTSVGGSSRCLIEGVRLDEDIGGNTQPGVQTPDHFDGQRALAVQYFNRIRQRNGIVLPFVGGHNCSQPPQAVPFRGGGAASNRRSISANAASKSFWVLMGRISTANTL